MDERGWRYGPDGNYSIFRLMRNKRIVGRLITTENEVKEMVRSLNALEQAEAEINAVVQWLSNCVFSNVWDTSTLPDSIATSLLDMLEEGGEE